MQKTRLFSFGPRKERKGNEETQIPVVGQKPLSLVWNLYDGYLMKRFLAFSKKGEIGFA